MRKIQHKIYKAKIIFLCVVLASCDGGSEHAGPVSENDMHPKTVTESAVKVADGGNGEGTFEVPPEVLADTYYIDCEASSGDQRSELGTRANPMTALEQINSVILQPGNKVLFKYGSTCFGMFRPAEGSTGAKGKPITLSAYGDKTAGRPVIAAGCRELKQAGVDYPRKEYKITDFVTAPDPNIPASELLANIVPYETNCATDEKPSNLAAIHLFNTQYWEIDTLELTNDASSSGNRLGLYVQLEDYGTGRHYKVSNVYVHHVRGRVADNDGLPNTYKTTGGILFSATRDTEVYGLPQKPTTFDGILVENSEIYEVDPIALATRSSWMCRKNGAPCGDYEPYKSNKPGPNIYMAAWPTARNDYTPMKNVVFRNNKIHNIGGDGIIMRTAVSPLVESNLIYDTWLRVPGNSAGAWAINTDYAVFRYNEVAGTRLQRVKSTNADGMAFDADMGARNTIFTHNFTHGNQGGTLLICGCGTDNMANTAEARDTIFENNLSVDDQQKLVFSAGSQATVVRNNVFLTNSSTPLESILLLDYNRSHIFTFVSNKFYSAKPNDEFLRIKNGEPNFNDVYFGGNDFYGYPLVEGTRTVGRYNEISSGRKDNFHEFDDSADFPRIIDDWMETSGFNKHRYRPVN